MDKINFISYPKSGRTWIRYILTLLESENRFCFHHDSFEFNDGNLPKHNFDINARIQKYSSSKVIYLERDPRDVMVSLYFQITGRFNDFFNYKGSMSEFIRDDYFGAKNLCRFREIWSNLTKEYNFLKITYEDAHEDMQTVINNILNYSNMQRKKEYIVKAIENANFPKMKKVEDNNLFDKPWLRKRQGCNKVREGKVGGFREYLENEDIVYLNSIFNIEDII